MFVRQECTRYVVISMDLTVCHKQIVEEWRQQIIVVEKHKFSSIERTDLEISRISNLENRGAVYVLDSLNFIGVCKAKARRHFFLLISPINLKTEIIKLELNNDMLKVNEQPAVTSKIHLISLAPHDMSRRFQRKSGSK